MVIGFAVIAAGLLVMAIRTPGPSPYVWLSLAAAVTGIGMGFAQPAANNATLHLARDDVAAIAGLRGMFRQAGGIMAISVTTAVLARSGNPGLSQAYVFMVFGVLLLAAIPVIFRVPNHRGSW